MSKTRRTLLPWLLALSAAACAEGTTGRPVALHTRVTSDLGGNGKVAGHAYEDAERQPNHRTDHR